MRRLQGERLTRCEDWTDKRYRFTLQIVPQAGLHSTAAMTNELAKRVKTEGMQAYVELVQKRERDLHCDVLRHQVWSGASYLDGIIGVIQSGNSGSRSMGEGNTEAFF